ncbi:MAG: cytochrome C [Alphaproteobacteria bacterium]|nr:cytochrome C [Alphaproteobacteria bacterium]
MRTGLCVAFTIALTAAPSFAQDRDVTAISRGLAYARQSCSSCHAVDAGQKTSPNPNAPSFQSVANMPGMTRIALNVWLHTSHPTMPQLIVDPYRIDDLAAYMATLKSDR